MASVISFRAECNEDWVALVKEMKSSGIKFSVQIKLEDSLEPKIELLLQTASIEDVFKCMLNVPDGHVMCDTLRPVSLEKNSLVRRYNYDVMPKDWMSNGEDDMPKECFFCLKKHTVHYYGEELYKNHFSHCPVLTPEDKDKAKKFEQEQKSEGGSA